MKRTALLIGLGSVYQPVNNLPTLGFSRPNIDRIATMLQSKGWDGVDLLTERDATKQNILAMLDRRFAEANSDDTILLYYCGHAAKSSANGSGEGAGDVRDEYLVTYTLAMDHMPITNATYFVTDNDLTGRIAAGLTAKIGLKFISMFDCCFAQGMIDKEAMAFPTHLFFGASLEGQLALSDSATDSFFNRAICQAAAATTTLGAFAQHIRTNPLLTSRQTPIVSIHPTHHSEANFI
jgi:hypothetical protein